MEKPNEIASKLLDDWDMKHFGRAPIANGSFQYNTRVDLVSMITQALREAEDRGIERAADFLLNLAKQGRDNPEANQNTLTVYVFASAMVRAQTAKDSKV